MKKRRLATFAVAALLAATGVFSAAHLQTGSVSAEEAAFATSSASEKSYVFKNLSGYANISTCDTVKGDKDVYVEFYLRSFDPFVPEIAPGTQILFQPYSVSMDGMNDLLYTTSERTLGQYTSTGNYGNWSGPEFVIPADGNSWAANLVAWNYQAWGYGASFVSRVRYVGRTDGSVSLYIYEHDAVNQKPDFVWTEKYRTKPDDGTGKNYFAKPAADKDYHIMFGVYGAAEISEIEFGTVEGGELKKMVGTKDLSDGTVQMESKTAAGKIYANAATGDIGVFETASEAGELTLPAFTPSAGKSFFGWISADSQKLYAAGDTVTVSAGEYFKAFEASFEMQTGASVRLAETAEESGIRFRTSYNTAELAQIGSFIASKGTLILPTDYLDGKEFVLDNFAAGEKVLKIPAEKTREEGDKTVFTGAIVSLRAGNYARAFSARGYAEITYTSGKTGYVYTAYNAQEHSRSVSEVAQSVKADTEAYEKLSEAKKSVVEAYIAAGQNTGK